MRLYVGMDLHSTNCYTGILDEEDTPRLSRKLPNDRSKIVSALAPYRKEIVGIAVESTYNWYWLVDALMAEGYPVHLANPAAMKQYQGIKHLDDRHDAFWLAKLLKLGILPTGYIYPRESRGLRDLLRQRSRFVVQRTSMKHTLQQIYSNHTGGPLNNNAISRLDAAAIQAALVEDDPTYIGVRLLDAIGDLERQIKAIEQYVLKKVQGTAPYSTLTTAPGIGVVLGLTITLETGPIDRFASAGHYASYCRCVPTAYWSNAQQKGTGNPKNGNKYLSWAFAEAANFAIRYFKPAKTFYQRKCAQTNPPVAYRALSNKLAKACYFMMRDQVPFDAQRLFGTEPNRVEAAEPAQGLVKNHKI
jgi:transposase